jgi:hypothetical protein
VIFIAHRGNTCGRSEKNENAPRYILQALNNGFYVEIDLWAIENKLFLGHDEPVYEIETSFLDKSELFVHCKNEEALEYLHNNHLKCEYFWHDSDKYTITSKGNIWTYMGSYCPQNSIALMPELFDSNIDYKHCYGICSDKVDYYRNIYSI